jgi:thiol-disulfide isomerase/thioredoxin
MHRYFPVFWALLALTFLVRADAAEPEPLSEAPVRIAPKSAGVGLRLADLSFTDLNNNSIKLSDYRSARAIVLCLTSTTCPIARKYGPTLVRLACEYQPKGVEFIAINVSQSEPTDDMKAALAAARNAGYQGRYIADRQQTVGRALGARSTTEVLVLDRARTLVYRGAIDEQYGLGYTLEFPRANYLRSALDAVLADDRPAIEATTAPGCALDLRQRESEAPSEPRSSALTYHNRISRLIQNNCVECHRKGENAPFELTTYPDVKSNAAMIKKVVNKGIMPPWFANAQPGTFHNDRSLTQQERNDLAQWIDAGCPEGNPVDAPVVRKWVTGWRIGQPDLILESPQTKSIPASGVVKYQYVTIPTTLTEDKWITAMEIRPSAPQVVHHILAFVELPRNDPRRAQFRGHRGGTNGYFAGMVPGQGHISFPPGTAKLLPKGATIVFQIHYTTNGAPAQDKPRIGFKFASEKPQYEVLTGAASNRFFVIPPNVPAHEIKASHTFFNPTRLLSLNPHSHLRGKAFKYELFYPDGRTQIILDIPRYAFNWQLEYQLAQPLDVPAGTRLEVTGWYDNSKNNPANPDPSKPVKWGDQTWEEMMIGYFTGHLLQ